MLRQFLDSVTWFDLPLIATGMFVAMFVVVLLRVSQKARRAEYDRMASLPLDDGLVVGSHSEENTNDR